MSEMLDIVDEDGVPTGRTVDREAAHRDGILHRTSHVWIVRLGPNGRAQVLVQKRAADKDSFPGCWDISSAGHIPAGDDWMTSALRELREELGVEAKPEDLQWLGTHRVEHDGDFHGKPFHNRQVSAVFVLRLDKPANEFQIQTSEIEAVEWTDLDDFIQAVRRRALPNCISLKELRWIKKKVWLYPPGEGPFRSRGYTAFKWLVAGLCLNFPVWYVLVRCVEDYNSPLHRHPIVLLYQLIGLPLVLALLGALHPRVYRKLPNAFFGSLTIFLFIVALFFHLPVLFITGWTIHPPQYGW